jgi:hypothetical protein
MRTTYFNIFLNWRRFFCPFGVTELICAVGAEKDFQAEPRLRSHFHPRSESRLQPEFLSPEVVDRPRKADKNIGAPILRLEWFLENVSCTRIAQGEKIQFDTAGNDLSLYPHPLI